MNLKIFKWIFVIFAVGFVMSACSHMQTAEPTKPPALATIDDRLTTPAAGRNSKKDIQVKQNKVSSEAYDNEDSVDCFYTVNKSDPLCSSAE